MAEMSDLSQEGQQQLNSDAEKWQRKASGASSKWLANLQESEDDGDYADGLSDRYGLSAGDMSADETWSEEVNQLSESDYSNRVEGKQDDWRDNFIRGL